MNSKKFGEYVHNRRYELGISITNAAEKMQISVVHLRNIETGKNSPRPETFFKIINALGLDAMEAITILEDEKVDRID